MTRQVFMAPTKNEIGFPEKEAYLIFSLYFATAPYDFLRKRQFRRVPNGCVSETLSEEPCFVTKLRLSC